MQPCDLICSVHPRIHVTLVGMDGNGYRINGGSGFSVEDPKITIRFWRSASFEFYDNRQFGFTKEEINRAIEHLTRIQQQNNRLTSSMNVEISGEMRTHHGFGSSTGVRLAVIEALFLINDVNISREQLAYLSGRGGTSGVGISTYFTGGFVTDLGHIGRTDMMPSSLAEARTSMPLTLLQSEMPKWQIGLCLSNNIEALTEKEEADFFTKICPIDSSQVKEANYHVIYGLTASVLENNFDHFCLSIRNLQNCRWKKEERSLYGDDLSKIESDLYVSGATAVGMSSLGPLLYFVSKDVKAVSNNFIAINKNCTVFMTSVRNIGRELNKC